MTLPEAIKMLDAGWRPGLFGAVYPMLGEPERDGEALKAQFVFGGVRRPRVEPVYDTCRSCGGVVVQTGTCKTCQTCGDNEGCS
jgi:hypothetical protein